MGSEVMTKDMEYSHSYHENIKDIFRRTFIDIICYWIKHYFKTSWYLKEPFLNKEEYNFFWRLRRVSNKLSGAKEEVGLLFKIIWEAYAWI